MAKVYIETISSSLYSRTLWDETGGTNYVVGNRVSLNDSLFSNAGGTIDDSHNRVYICIADNNSTTHPFDDPTNWVLAGSSEEYPSYAVDGSICTNSMNNEVYLEYEANRYKGKGANRFTWNQATAQGTEHGELIFGDGEYYDDSKGFSVANINFTAKNTGKVSITTVGSASHIFQGNSINDPETTDISTHTGIKFIIGGNRDLQHNQLALAFISCVITDRNSSVGTYSASSFRLGNNGNFLNLKNTLIDLPNSTIALMGYNMVLFKGQKSLWENSTIYSSAGSGNQYLPIFYGNTSNLLVKRCIFAFTTTQYNSDNWSLGFPDGSSENLAYVYDKSAKQIGQEAGVMIQDPLFVNSAEGDFRLRPSSSLIGGLQEDNTQKASLERQYPEGKWFDSNAAAGGDGSWETPYNNYAEAINSFTGDEAVVLIKEGQHPLQSGYWDGSAWGFGIDLPKVYSGGIKFIGTGSDCIFTTNTNIINFGAFYNNTSGANPNSRATPFVFKDLDILLNNPSYINRGLINACRSEYINVNVSQAPNLGAINSQLFDYVMTSGSGDSGEYLKMTGCTINVSHSANSNDSAYLVGNNSGLKQFQSCTFADLDRATSRISSPPSHFIHYDFGSYAGSFIKDCIIYSKTTNTTRFGTSTSSGSHQGALNLEVKNCVVYSTQGSVSIGSNYGDGVKELDPKFIATEPHDFDFRLRPDSSGIGGIKSEPTNVYYLQPGNPFNGDGSQKDASTMTTDGDPGPFNEFKEIVAAGVPYGSTIVILNGTYDWTESFGRAPSTNVAANTWHAYTCAGYNYVAETMHGVIFDAKHDPSNVFVYKPYGGTAGAGVFLDLDTTFTGVQFNNMIGLDNTTRNQISSVSGSAGLGSCTFKNCKFLGHINTATGTSYPWTGGGRSRYSSTMHWENCEISIAFDNAGGLLCGGDSFADDTYHGSWSWKNCTFYIPTGLTTFSGRNAANGTYASPSLIFGVNYNQTQRIFKNNIIHIPNGAASIGVNGSNKLPNIENNCFNGVNTVYGTHDHEDILIEKNNLLGAEPLFIDPSNNNFALRPLSSLIGQGK